MAGDNRTWYDLPALFKVEPETKKKFISLSPIEITDKIKEM